MNRNTTIAVAEQERELWRTASRELLGTEEVPYAALFDILIDENTSIDVETYLMEGDTDEAE